MKNELPPRTDDDSDDDDDSLDASFCRISDFASHEAKFAVCFVFQNGRRAKKIPREYRKMDFIRDERPENRQS